MISLQICDKSKVMVVQKTKHRKRTYPVQEKNLKTRTPQCHKIKHGR